MTKTKRNTFVTLMSSAVLSLAFCTQAFAGGGNTTAINNSTSFVNQGYANNVVISTNNTNVVTNSGSGNTTAINNQDVTVNTGAINNLIKNITVDNVLINRGDNNLTAIENSKQLYNLNGGVINNLIDFSNTTNAVNN
jgi:hypothetical protein